MRPWTPPEVPMSTEFPAAASGRLRKIQSGDPSDRTLLVLSDRNDARCRIPARTKSRFSPQESPIVTLLPCACSFPVINRRGSIMTSNPCPIRIVPAPDAASPAIPPLRRARPPGCGTAGLHRRDPRDERVAIPRHAAWVARHGDPNHRRRGVRGASLPQETPA